VHHLGHEFPVEVSVSPSISTDIGYFSNFIRDITEHKRAQQELLNAKQAAEDAKPREEHFLANMSHELRTPLNAIIGYSEMLQEETQELGKIAVVKDLGKIQSAGKHLLSLINEHPRSFQDRGRENDAASGDVRCGQGHRRTGDDDSARVAKNSNTLQSILRQT